ncbi:alpha/beta-Hydrolases superfamily protein [Striga hermonthica]|uniref:Alpha/beta-Hydrolases superfamily protein n=1 Tax=Striga hermonthica TaxID=68872 RepID=A0A9N7N3E3_STRHE|nr:alpha/beta-Hydrolases superfamily protein [Striga hermonthica]
MDCFEEILETPAIAYELLFKSVAAIPLSHYLVGTILFLVVFWYNFLEFHFFQDLFTGFRGGPVLLTYNPSSEIYHGVVAKCRALHGRYLATPWLSSPHIQTSFVNFLGRPPVFAYRRQMFHAPDGGTFALDWLLHSDVVHGVASTNNNAIAKDDKTPIVVMIPGLTSDSASPYMKHLVFDTAKNGWNVVVSNHRGLGGVSVTSDCFYNAGWTEDARRVINHLHHEYSEAPLFVVGTSIGANILVKYLGEDGENVPIAGAAAVCSPWDLLIGSRFISRRLIQKLYDRALTIGLQGYAQLHETRYSRLANWEGIKKRDSEDKPARFISALLVFGRCTMRGLCLLLLNKFLRVLARIRFSHFDNQRCTLH